jgi:hypothetical protein
MESSHGARARAGFGTKVPETFAHQGDSAEKEAETDSNPSRVGEDATTPPSDVVETTVKTP